MRGFSLVELSIVLVILGLLTGGILAGQSLIRASELRAVSSEYQRYAAAINTFRDKYFALPGDMSNATKFWGAAHATPATCKTTAPTGTQTCDGDGNGQVLNTAVGSYESFGAWRQLALSGLVEGSYTGKTNAGLGDYWQVPGENSPISKMGRGTWVIYYRTTNGSFPAINSNILSFGAPSNDFADAGIIKAEEAWNIDTKMDDGKPAYGSVFNYENTTRPNCVSTNVPSTAEYILTNTTNGCNVQFKVN